MNNLVTLDESCFIFNNKQNKVLNSLRLNLSKLTNKNNCSYYFSIAFITQAGLAPLLMLLKQLDDIGIKGKIITSDYLNYTSPTALDKLLSLKHVELKIFKCTSFGFHTKGYIFMQEQNCELILGSSNLTLSALSTNHEWNVAIKADLTNGFIQTVINEFNSIWTSNNCLYYKDYKQEYQKLYAQHKSNITPKQTLNVKANAMQQNFVKAFTRAYTNGIKKGLLLSATGTGKTIACMLALKNLNVKRVLFVVHRELIARQAQITCKQILNKDSALFIGKQKDIQAEYIFATFQSLYAFNKNINASNYTVFNKNYFDIIIIDEAHHIGASSYKSIIDYFEPKFLLGMSASIKRSDNFDTLSYFDNNVIYEISLKEALANNYLCPFHYYAISDIELIDDNTALNLEANKFNKLDFNLRVDKIIEAANYYGMTQDQLCGLIFCSTNKEALMLEQSLNQKGFATKALSAKHNQVQREDAIKRLCSNRTDKLDYIITVDIFNEGIDIPMVNQIIMLRPTQSALVFIQQLGRGLRHFPNKEFVVILDFIGNYNNNYMIPLALSSNSNLNKEELRLFTLEPNSYLNGTCSINIDKVATTKILNALDKVNFNAIKYLKDSYFDFALRFKSYPLCYDFAINGQISPKLYFDKFGSLYNFQKQYDKNFNLNLTTKQALYIEYICKYLCDGKRTSELDILDLMSQGLSYNNAKAKLKQKESDNNCINFLLNNFDYQSNKFDDLYLIEAKGDDYYLTSDFKSCFDNRDFIKVFKDLLKFNTYIFSQEYNLLYEDTAFCLYKTYSYHDILRLLGLAQKLPPIDIGGGKFFKELNTMPLFINYIKDDEQNKQHYTNKFLENKALLWYSKANTKLTSPAISALVEQDKLKSTILIFVRKYQKAKDKSYNNFYFLGKAYTDSYKIVNVNNKSLIEFKLNLKTVLDSAIFDYLSNY